MFRSNRTLRYTVDQETLRLNVIQTQKSIVLDIAADFIESQHTEEDKTLAIEKLEQCRAIIMELFSKKIVSTNL
jgi:hypothetical protein